MTEFRPGRFQILPTIVKNLIIINAIMVFAHFVLGKFGIDLVDHLGLHHWKSAYFRPWQLITHMFMHGGIAHIFFNMFSLWMFGSVLENIWGPKRFLIFYLICGLGAAALHMGVVAYEFYQIERAFAAYQANPGVSQLRIFIDDYATRPMGNTLLNNLYNVYNYWASHPGSDMAQESFTAINRYLHGYTYAETGQYFDGIFDEATVGASGAVFGILFAFGYLFPNTLLYIYFLVPIKAKYVVGGLALIELFSGIQNSAGDNIAHFAHLGGMLMGFILLKIWNKRNRHHFY